MMKRLAGVLVIVLVLLCASAALAYVTGDDYECKDWQYDVETSRRFLSRECTDFVAWCLITRNDIWFWDNLKPGTPDPIPSSINNGRWGNAKCWPDVARALEIDVDHTPAVGAVACWTSGNYGHVAWVKSVNADGKITIEEYNWEKGTNNNYYGGIFSERTISANNPAWYIHVRDIVNPNHNPVTTLDTVTIENGKIKIHGWAYDPDDTSASLDIHVYEKQNGTATFIGRTTANTSRPDVNKVYQCGDNHGYDAVFIPLVYGDVEVIAYAIDSVDTNLHTGDSKSLSVPVNHDPSGGLEQYAGRAGAIYVCGWAKDDDTPDQSIYLDVYVGGPAGSGAERHRIIADKYKSNLSGNYGFEEVIPVSITGSQPFYVYALNSVDGNNPLIGSATVTIAEPAYLDVNFLVDGIEIPTLEGIGSFRIRIGDITYDGQTDFNQQVSEGVPYEILEFKISTAHKYLGVAEGALSGIMGSSNVSISASFASTFLVRYLANTTDSVYHMIFSQRKTKGEALTLASEIPARMGYSFRGWSSSSTALEASYQPGDIYVEDEAIDLYALWAELEEMKLPENLQIIEDQAFYGSAGGSVTIPKSVSRIGSKAFGNCEQLMTVVIYADTEQIENDAFVGHADGLTIYCEQNSAAHVLAQEQGILFVLIDQ